MTLDLPLKNIVRRGAASIDGGQSIFFLHGFGSNMQDLDGLSTHFDDSWTSISLQASIPVQFNGWAWAELDYSNLGVLPKPNQMIKHYESIIESIDKTIILLNLDPKKINLLGFSQGAALAMYCGLIRPEKFRSIVAICGFLPMNQINDKIDSTLVKNLNLLMANGTLDSVVPLTLAKSSRDDIVSLGIRINYIEYEMEHTISYDCLKEVLSWLSKKNEN